MKHTLIILFSLIAINAHADSYFRTPTGGYNVSTYGTTTQITQMSKTNSTQPAIIPSAPVNINPVTGTGTLITPQGVYIVQQTYRGETNVIQVGTSK